MFISIFTGETGRILSEGRTSSNAWCQGECPKDPLVKQIVRKIEEVTGVPGVNYESFQVLKVRLALITTHLLTTHPIHT